ncbi:TPA: hypothetical protein RZC51_003999 [Burkholderia cenocepacia]|nr:hypothetical protein [Burkholderia cenocepacia]
MDATPDNPARNTLNAGVTEVALLDAIAKSGYPLQTRVAENLSAHFHVQEEWSYRDRDSNALRTLDMLASKPLFDMRGSHPRVRPQLNILIECKQSDLPFVFFDTRHRPRLSNFPVLAGLKSNTIELVTDDDLSTWTLPILNALGLDRHEFVADVPISSTFSKCARRSGGGVELSGEDSYNGVVLPLIKATSHFENAESPRPTFAYFDAHLTIPVAVLNAPMVLVQTTNAQPTARMTPWVRVARHEYDGDTEDWRKDRLWAIDVVHEDYLNIYIEQHVQPFAEEFARLALEHDAELAACQGFCSGLGKDSYRQIANRLSPRPLMHKPRRTAGIAWRIVTLPHWLWKSR